MTFNGFLLFKFSFKFAIMLGTFLLKNELLLGSVGLILILLSFFLILTDIGLISFNNTIGMEPFFDLRCLFEAAVCMLALIFFSLCQYSVSKSNNRAKMRQHTPLNTTGHLQVVLQGTLP